MLRPAVSLFTLPAAFTLPVNIVLIILVGDLESDKHVSVSLSATFLWRPLAPFFFLTSQVPGGGGPPLGQFCHIMSTHGETARTRPRR